MKSGLLYPENVIDDTINATMSTITPMQMKTTPTREDAAETQAPTMFRKIAIPMHTQSNTLAAVIDGQSIE